MRLTAAQWDMLSRIAESQYGEHHVRPLGHRTADVLVRHGLLSPQLHSWYAITPKGREIVAARKAVQG
jgi:hypothetical protein